MGDKAQKFSEVVYQKKRKSRVVPSCLGCFGCCCCCCWGGVLFFAFLLSEDPGDTQGRAENRADEKGSPPQRQPQAVHTEARLAEDTFWLSKLV